MYPITNEVKALFDAEQRKVLRITGTDKNGAVISITDNDVIADSFQVDRYSCNGEKLEVGTAIAAQMSLTLENGGGQYNGIVFEGAELFVEVGIADWTQSSPTITYVPCGYFTPDEQPRRLSTISITGLDRMTKFDVVVDAADLTFPATVAGLVGQVCTVCGVTLAQSISGLVNAGVNVAELPTAQEEITYRNLIQWCAGIMGTNAWFDWNGQLRFSWYENATGYVSTVDNRYSSDLYEDDLTVSGIEYTNDSGIVIVEGTDDYAIDLTGNAIAGPLVATVLPPLNTALNGFTYRPFTAATVNAPYLWPMDIVTFTDKDGNNHTSALTNVAFGLNGTTAMESKGMTYAINKLAQPKGFTREQAQLVAQAMEHVEQDIDESLTQQEIFNRLTNNGAAQGLVLYNGQLYINASYIQSGTLVLGGLNNQNGTLRVLNAAGQVVGSWTNDGIEIDSGRIQLSQETQNVTATVLLQQSVNEPFKVVYTSNSMDVVTKSDGRIFIIEDNNDNTRISISPTQLALSEDSTVWFTLSYFNGSPEMLLYGDAFIDGDTRIKGDLSLDNALDINYGGTGATTAAGARTNLGVTPANIGAVAKSGDTMTGPLNIRSMLFSHCIELIPPVGVGNGGYVDFAYNGEEVDFTSRIIEGQRGVLDVNGVTFQNGNLTGKTNGYSWDLGTENTADSWVPVLNTSMGLQHRVLPSWLNNINTVPVDHGGTNATTPAGARANLDVPSTTGSGASGTWNINVLGGANALTSTDFQNSCLSYRQSDDTFFGSASGWEHFIICNHGDGSTYFNYTIGLPFWGKPQYKRQTGSQSAQTPWYEFLTTESPVLVTEGGTGATDAPGARANLGIATTVMTVTTTGITSNGNWISDLEPNKVVIDAAYCTAGTVAVTPYCNSGGKWAFHCIDVSTGAAYGTAFDLTIRYHNIY